MKHVYPPRHPASLDASPGAGPSPAPPGPAPRPPRPHEDVESSKSPSSATPTQQEVGRQAYGNAVDGTADTDRGPVMDQVYNEKVAPHRGPSRPRR